MAVAPPFMPSATLPVGPMPLMDLSHGRGEHCCDTASRTHALGGLSHGFGEHCLCTGSSSPLSLSAIMFLPCLCHQDTTCSEEEVSDHDLEKYVQESAGASWQTGSHAPACLEGQSLSMCVWIAVI